MQLRPYQTEAEQAFWDYLVNCQGNPAIVIPTGGGKSPLMASIAVTAARRGWRVGILAHVQELVEQNASKLLTFAPGAPIGVYSVGLKRRDRHAQILFMQIQSVAKRAAMLGKFDLLLVDEAHRIPLAGDGIYRQFFKGALDLNPALRIGGMTATPYRLQGRAIPVCGPSSILTEIAYEANVRDLVHAGYLSRLISRAGDRPDTSAVHVRGNEYVEAELASLFVRDDLVQRTVDDMCKRARDRRAWIVFCVNVTHAQMVTDELRRRGITAAMIHGGTDPAERARSIAAFQAMQVRAMVNVNVLSEGFDAPHIDMVAMLRLTKSPGMYYQQVGRGFRLHPDKTDCLILDYAGNVMEHGPVDAIQPRAFNSPDGGKRDDQPKAKECPECRALLPLGARICPDPCGHQFGDDTQQHSDRPIDADVLSRPVELVTTTTAVRGVKYSVHQKPGKTPTLKVSYRCGISSVSEWICFEHTGVAQMKAARWWCLRSTSPVPRTVAEAIDMADSLIKPTSITVEEGGKYPVIKGYELEPIEGAEQENKGNDDPGIHPAIGGSSGPAGSDPVQRVRELPAWYVRAMGG